MSFHESSRSVVDESALVGGILTAPGSPRKRRHPAAKCGSSSDAAPYSLPDTPPERNCRVGSPLSRHSGGISSIRLTGKTGVKWRLVERDCA